LKRQNKPKHINIRSLIKQSWRLTSSALFLFPFGGSIMKKIILMFLFLMVFSIPAFAQAVRIAYTDTTTMRAPANSAAIFIGGKYSKILWYFKVATINTSVGVALQTKVGNGQWTNVWADSLVCTVNDNYGLEWDNAALADSIRFKWISEGGGTTALITHNAILFGGN